MDRTPDFDLDAYFRRIGYHGPRQPDGATLAALHALHPAAIPFENLDPLLGRPVRLDLTSLQAKLVGQHRGGYCFEQNTLFAAALRALGFRVRPLAARVRWNATADHPEGPRSHMLLSVCIDATTWLADVGFGGYLLAAPIRLIPDLVQSAGAATVRVLVGHPGFIVQAAFPAGWRDLYRFTLEPQLADDYAIANWFTSTNPGSFFTGNLVVERLTPTDRRRLFNRRFTCRDPNGGHTERLLASPRDLAAVLTDEFGLRPPVAADLVWPRLPSDDG